MLAPVKEVFFQFFHSPYAANFNNPANFADPSGGTSYFFCEIAEFLNIGGGSPVAGGLGALATGGNAIRIAIDLKQSMGEAGRQLMEEYMNATGGPGGYVQTTANQDGYVWDPNATPDTPGFIEPGKNVRLSTGEYLYYTNEFDVSLQPGLVDLDRPINIESPRKVANTEGNWFSNLSFSDVGHCVLDFAGMIPLFGAAADAINVGWYLL